MVAKAVFVNFLHRVFESINAIDRSFDSALTYCVNLIKVMTSNSFDSWFTFYASNKLELAIFFDWVCFKNSSNLSLLKKGDCYNGRFSSSL